MEPESLGIVGFIVALLNSLITEQNVMYFLGLGGFSAYVSAFLSDKQKNPILDIVSRILNIVGGNWFKSANK